MPAQVKLKFEQPPPGTPFTTWAEVIAHLNKAQTGQVLGVSEYVLIVEGELPDPDDRALPLMVTDKDGNLLYWAKYVAEGDLCCNEGEVCPLAYAEVGELKTIFRTANSMADEVVAKKNYFSCGWTLADGDGAGAAFPDLTGDPVYFTGSTPNWTKYTIVYVGTSS